MNRKHAAIIATILALAAVVGAFATLRTTQVGGAAGAKPVSAQIARQEAALNAQEAALRKALLQPVSTAGPTVTASPRIVYVRPAPHVVTIHRHSDDGGSFDD